MKKVCRNIFAAIAAVALVSSFASCSDGSSDDEVENPKPEDGKNPESDKKPEEAVAGTSVAGVFSRDYKTTVNVKILKLGSAYNTVPDLRDPQLEIGVSVDMDWVQVEPSGIKLSY